MPVEKFQIALNTVMQQLPQEVRHTLTTFWECHPTKDPSTKAPRPAPQWLLVVGLFDRTAPDEEAVAIATHPGSFIFDQDLVIQAPIEVVESLIAESLADAYLKIVASTRFPWSEAAPAENVHPLMAGWGFHHDEVEMYLAVKEGTATNPDAAYYAFRYARYGRPPPQSADIDAIVDVLRTQNRRDLEVNLRRYVRSTVRIVDFETHTVAEIPRSELAPGYILSRVGGIEGDVYVDITHTRVSTVPLHGGLSEEFKRVIRHCRKLVGDTDPRSYQEHEQAFLIDRHPKNELMVYFHCAVVFRHFATSKVIARTKRLRMWLWIIHCSMSEPSTVMETWGFQPKERPMCQKIADFYYACDHEREFGLLFDPQEVQPVPLEGPSSTRSER